MPPAPLLQLSGLTLGYGGDPLFRDLDLTVHPGDRLALVGRNGSGKSTLMKVMAGLIEPDSGTRTPGPGVTVAYLDQDPDFAAFPTLGAFATAGLDPADHWRVAAAAEGLGFDPDRPAATASGGERRRAALARLIAAEAELWLLDEPTNHLDIAAIAWLEARLRDSRAGVIVISHDRAFLQATARGLLWLDRGVLRRLDAPYAAFEDWRDRVFAEEDLARHKLDRRIKAEGRWAVEGISARRKRNQGRLRALERLRAERAAQIRRQGTAALAIAAAAPSGRLVAELHKVSKSFGGQPIVRDLTLTVQRGERLALVGPNGAGKTTLLKLLLGELPPDAGTVRLGTGLRPAVFDQARARLDPDASLWENLTGDPELGVSGRADQVMVRGQPRHVVGYLRDFLFDEAQARAPVRALSGGERARLMLAKLFARDCNLLVLDEPTNDLDIETLDLLQDLIGEFDGTVLLVSHDRDFIDRIATATLVLEGQGRATLYAGGWSDMVAQRGAAPFGPAAPAPLAAPAAPARAATAPAGPAPAAAPAARRPALTGAQRRRLAALPAEIDRIATEIARLEALLADPGLYARAPVKFARASEMLAQRQQALAAAEAEWLDLAERAEG
jgi:ATP-binding cassette subfamily F protein uup